MFETLFCVRCWHRQTVSAECLMCGCGALLVLTTRDRIMQPIRNAIWRASYYIRRTAWRLFA